MSDDLQAIKEIEQKLNEKNNQVEKTESSPKEIITSSLVDFFLFRLKRLYQDLDFQAYLKEELRTRTAEAEFNDIKSLLHQQEENTNKAIQNLFLPFFYKLQEIQTQKDIPIDEQLSSSLPFDILQSLNELNSFLTVLKKNKDTNADIKQALEASLEEK